MNNKKLLGIITAIIGSTLFLFSLGVFFSYSFSPSMVWLKILHSSFFGLLKSLSLPLIIFPISGILMLVLGLSFIFLGLLFSSSAIFLNVCILMLVVGLFSIILSLGFFTYPFNFFSLFPLLIFVSGMLYIPFSLFLLKKKVWVRKLVIVHSIVLILCFMPFSIYCALDPSGWGMAVTFSTVPYIIYPLFFIIFFTRPKIKELFKK